MKAFWPSLLSPSDHFFFFFFLILSSLSPASYSLTFFDLPWPLFLQPFPLPSTPVFILRSCPCSSTISGLLWPSLTLLDFLCFSWLFSDLLFFCLHGLLPSNLLFSSLSFTGRLLSALFPCVVRPSLHWPLTPTIIFSLTSSLFSSAPIFLKKKQKQKKLSLLCLSLFFPRFLFFSLRRVSGLFWHPLSAHDRLSDPLYLLSTFKLLQHSLSSSRSSLTPFVLSRVAVRHPQEGLPLMKYKGHNFAFNGCVHSCRARCPAPISPAKITSQTAVIVMLTPRTPRDAELAGLPALEHLLGSPLHF